MNNFTPEQIEQFLEEFFNVVGRRQYVGARYVPLFGRKDESSIEWDNTKPYEPLTIVLHQGNSYTSRTYVPTGIAITDTTYWANTGNYNAQIEMYRRETLALQEDYDRIDLSKCTCFDTVQDMQSDEHLEVGMICHTNGFNIRGDGGAAFYTISSSGTPNGMDVLACAEGMYATLVITKPYVTPEMFGAWGDGTHDDTTSIQTAIDKCKNVAFSGKTYAVTSPIVISSSGTYVYGCGSNLKQTTAGENTLEISGTEQSRIDDVTIQDISLSGDYVWNGTVGDGNGTTKNGCFAEYASNCKFSNVDFIDNGSSGFACGYRVWACTFERCRFYRNKLYGFDTSNIYESSTLRTGSTLNFISCFFGYNVAGYKGIGLSCTVLGGWFEGNNYAISTYAGVPASNLNITDVDFENNLVSVFEVNSAINALIISGNYIQHSGSDSVFVVKTTGTMTDWKLDVGFYGTSSLIRITEPTTIIYIDGLDYTQIPSEYSLRIVLGKGTLLASRKVLLEDITNPYDGLVNPSSLTLSLNSRLMIKPRGSSSITKLECESTDHFVLYYQSGENVYSTSSTTVDGKEVATTRSPCVMIGAATNNQQLSNMRVTYLN